MELITINQASQISGKSVQTIRRMIKRNKIRVKRQKTPQGFNYLVIKESLDFMSGKNDEQQVGNFENSNSHTSHETESIIQNDERQHRSISHELGKFATTIQDLVKQNEQDKKNFFELIKTFQDRVVSLENQIKMLEAPKQQSSWWQIWK